MSDMNDTDTPELPEAVTVNLPVGIPIDSVRARRIELVRCPTGRDLGRHTFTDLMMGDIKALSSVVPIPASQAHQGSGRPRRERAVPGLRGFFRRGGHGWAGDALRSDALDDDNAPDGDDIDPDDWLDGPGCYLLAVAEGGLTQVYAEIGAAYRWSIGELEHCPWPELAAMWRDARALLQERERAMTAARAEVDRKRTR